MFPNPDIPQFDGEWRPFVNLKVNGPAVLQGCRAIPIVSASPMSWPRQPARNA